MSIFSSRPPVFQAGHGIAYTYLSREDGRFVVFRTFGGATTALSSFGKESAARREAQRLAEIDRAVGK